MNEAEALQAQAAALREALEAAEWYYCRDGGYCPWCERSFRNGHTPDCKRQIALATDAGRPLLERLRRAEAERDEMKRQLAVLAETSRAIVEWAEI